jgi:hypothetical protein
MARVFTREEFYELVWSKPMTHLAKEFAMSDVALHKICRKHDIPNPPLGWWAKKAAGQKVKRKPLPKAQKGTAEKVVISGGHLGPEPDVVASAREQARVLASAHVDDHAVVHPIVERTIARLRKMKPSAQGLVVIRESALIACEVAPQSIDRLHLILGRITAAAAVQGFKLIAGEHAAAFDREGETLHFSLKEAVKRVKHELTDKEQAEEAKWQRKMERRHQNPWDWEFQPRPKFPEWDFHPTRQLSFELEEVYISGGQSPRKSFRDAKIQRLENMANDIAVGMAALLAAKIDQRRKWEEQQRKREEERRQREAAQRARKIEEGRAAALSEILSELEQLDRLRRLVSQLRDHAGLNPAGRVAEFVAWSERHLTGREAALSADGLNERFESKRLFGEGEGEELAAPHRFYGLG